VRLEGKVAVVTGGATGIGKGTALRFATEGAKVVVADVDEVKGLEVVDEARKAGGQAEFILLDVTSESDWDALRERVVADFGRVDVLFNNAGIAIMKPLAETTIDEWNRVMAVNATGQFLGMRTIVPLMAENGGGVVINTSSDAGMIGTECCAAYGASKGASRLLTKHIAIEFASRGVRVNSIHPAWVDTGMKERLADVFELTDEDLNSYAPLGRTCRVDEVASLVTFLASDEAAYCTGAEYLIDGGACAH
jgi:NAD(P)-dependent dehydrogenase (short-subunit alcohol dehydrogenase family)